MFSALWSRDAHILNGASPKTNKDEVKINIVYREILTCNRLMSFSCLEKSLAASTTSSSLNENESKRTVRRRNVCICII